MWKILISIVFTCLILLSLSTGCKKSDRDTIITDDPKNEEPAGFLFGADLSYVNQILDHDGVYRDSGVVENPYKIFREYGTNLVRLRLWHNPTWTLDVYDEPGTQMYNDLFDVEKAIRLSKEQGMSVVLDFHYSDTWADPGKQYIPEAWLAIRDIGVLCDSVYNYTFNTLSYLDGKGLMPEFVQIGNEINCGLFISRVPDGFPDCNNCNGAWTNLRSVIKSGIRAVREVSSNSAIDTKVILHIADPVNVEWWFENMMNNGALSDFEIIGFSYYPIWHTGVSISQLKQTVAGFKNTFRKDVMIMETAYPWTTEGNDNYNNLFGAEAVSGFPITPEGQLDIMKTITKNLIDGGGIGIVYWEPAWISSNMRDLWNTGSSWENNAFFDFDGNVNMAFTYMTYDYTE
ncbi:MAG: glycosyl hydrolase 53 family protein [Bacteroidales bacterium]|nr:glycosyl hydrolase 53 family protein [Bacteroidales bacterium]